MTTQSFLKILIMGLPGSGKTSLARDLVYILNDNYKCYWLNADKVREQFNDWDFSEVGRERQAKRMKDLANLYGQYNEIVICDFVCPSQKTRNKFDPNFLIFMNTIDRSSYEDTNKAFEPPTKFDFEVRYKNSNYYSKIIYNEIVHKMNKKV
jgi:adenylylsulfate kinase